MNHLSIDRGDQSTDKESLVGKQTLFDKLKTKLSSRALLEYGIVLILVIAAFVLSMIHFLNQSVQSLVPFSSISACNSASEVYNLVPQNIEITYPVTLTITNINTGKIADGYTAANVYSRWSSCLQQSVTTLQLYPETSVIYEPIVLILSESDSDLLAFNRSTSTNNDCFKLYCGVEFLFHADHDVRRDYNAFLNNSVYANLFYSTNDAFEIVNGTATLVNNQIITSIIGTNNSVVASCALSLSGTYFELFSVSNSVGSTGTYLCTQNTSPLQAISSALSIALSAIGFCRVYFLSKNYMARK